MPKITLYDTKAKEVGEIELPDDIFAVKVSTPAMHQLVKSYLANQRQGTQSTLTRTEVSGGGRKPWRQKGTGRARHGSTRSPQWTHGGVALGPKPRSYSFSVNKKLRKLALKSALSSKLSDNEIIVIDEFDLPGIKTKDMREVLNAFNAENSTLIVTDVKNDNVVYSARNLPGVKTTLATTLNVYDILKHDKFLMTKDAAEKIGEVYA